MHTHPVLDMVVYQVRLRILVHHTIRLMKLQQLVRYQRDRNKYNNKYLGLQVIRIVVICIQMGMIILIEMVMEVVTVCRITVHIRRCNTLEMRGCIQCVRKTHTRITPCIGTWKNMMTRRIATTSTDTMTHITTAPHTLHLHTTQWNIQYNLHNIQVNTNIPSTVLVPGTEVTKPVTIPITMYTPMQIPTPTLTLTTTTRILTTLTTQHIQYPKPFRPHPRNHHNRRYPNCHSSLPTGGGSRGCGCFLSPACRPCRANPAEPSACLYIGMCICTPSIYLFFVVFIGLSGRTLLL